MFLYIQNKLSSEENLIKIRHLKQVAILISLNQNSILFFSKLENNFLMLE